MEKENKLDGFSGKIGENIPSTNAEKEEDLFGNSVSVVEQRKTDYDAGDLYTFGYY